MAKQRDNCQQCMAPVLKVFINGRPVVLDWPRHEHGDVAVEHALNGTWFARALPVGAPLLATEQRFRRHDCELSAPAAGPQTAAEPISGPVPADQVKRWQQAVAARNRELRNRRGRRPGKAAAAIEKPGMYVKRPEGKP